MGPTSFLQNFVHFSVPPKCICLVLDLPVIYGKPAPEAVHQNNLTFYSAYNPKNPSELLFKKFVDCQEIAIVANVPFTNEQLLMNAVDLITCCSHYLHDMDDWECKPIAKQTYQSPSIYPSCISMLYHTRLHHYVGKQIHAHQSLCWSHHRG